MPSASRLAAAMAYVPVAGWLYVLLRQRRDALAIYHLKQAIGLVVFLAAVTAGWFVIAWLVAWIPYMFVFGVALFTLVIAAYLFGVAAWLLGISNALRAQLMPLPLFGQWAHGLPL